MDQQIVQALEEAGRLTTPELAIRLGADRTKVYRCCKQLERAGRLKSELVKTAGKNIYFFPMTRDIVTEENYERIIQMNETIAETIRAYSLPEERIQLITALEVRFEQLGERVTGTHREAFEEFAEEVLNAAATTDKRGEITGLLGIRPMRPPVRAWSLGRQMGLM